MTHEEQRAYWREHTARNHSKNAVAQRAAERAREKQWALENAVDRDPCPNCGTRRDIGCKHSRRVA